MKLLDATVYPSTEKTIRTDDKPDGPDYGGAHYYNLQNSEGFDKSTGKTKYVDSYQNIQFVMKRDDGSFMEGILSEQLLLVLIDRHNKLNAKFPSREGALAITKMEEALHWMQARVKERMDRGVMGDLKK